MDGWVLPSLFRTLAAAQVARSMSESASPSCQPRLQKMQAIRGFLPAATASYPQKQQRTAGHQLPKAAATGLCLRVGQKRPRTWSTRCSASAEQLSSQTAQLPALQSTSPLPLHGDGQIPAAPGVYAVYDAQGTLQYIGLSRKASAWLHVSLAACASAVQLDK